MPIINNPNRITDYEIEKALTDDAKMEKLLEKIFRIFSKQSDGSLKVLQKKMEPYMIEKESPEIKRKALKTIKEFLEK